MDALGKAHRLNPIGGHNEREQTLNQLLVEMDGFDPREEVIILAAINRPDILDLALFRPGRLNRNAVTDKPDIRGQLVKNGQKAISFHPPEMESRDART